MTASASGARLSRPAQIAFVAFMLALTGLFLVLGTWQVQRLAEKQALIATVEERFDQAPIAFPPSSEWAQLDPETIDYTPFTLTGEFVHDQTVLIFTNLPDPVGPVAGVGYWVMAPFVLDDTGVVWVNRGFVPQDAAADFADGREVRAGTVAIEGIARRPERANAFTPAPDIEARREWVRDPQRLSALVGLEETTAPVTLDLGQDGDIALPQGGETQITFPNRHLEYAGTWYLFAAITPIMLGFWLWRQRRPRNLAQPDQGN